MDRTADKKNKYLYLDRLQREINDIERKRIQLKEDLNALDKEYQEKRKEFDSLTDDGFTAMTLARVHDQRKELRKKKDKRDDNNPLSR